MHTRYMIFLPLTFLILMLENDSCVAQHSFQIYAPSRSTQELLVIGAQVDSRDSDSEDIEFTISARVPLGFAGATICRHPDKSVLYVAPSQTQWDAGKSITSGAIVRLDESGACSEIDAVIYKHGYAYMSVDRTGNFLLGSNYHDGQIDVYRLDGRGLIDEHVATVDEGRRNAHCILPSPDNRFLYVPYVKQTNALFQYTFNSGTGKVVAMRPKNVKPPAGTGPRHIAYHPFFAHCLFQQ